MEASKALVEDNNASVIILNSDSDDESKNKASTHKNRTKKRKRRRTEAPVIDLSSPVSAKAKASNLCDVSSTTVDLSESVIIEETKSSLGTTLPEFIPLCENKLNSHTKDFVPYVSVENRLAPVLNAVSHEDKEVVILSSDEDEDVPRPIAVPVKLRPIVIDGSNVARLHGRPTNTYSCKGIKICVEYFLNRGHTEVTAFVPMYRRHCKKGIIATTDQDVLEELDKTQHVVFTPSRRVEGKSYTCYDDRFIVELAASNGGVILSNDNFKDLLDVSPEFRETIQKRLLMFCFVGDKLMIPDDPLGSGGPRLPEFLSFPPS